MIPWWWLLIGYASIGGGYAAVLYLSDSMKLHFVFEWAAVLEYALIAVFWLPVAMGLLYDHLTGGR